MQNVLRKTILFFIMAIICLSIFSVSFAIEGDEVLNSTQATELINIKESTKDKLASYIEKYGSTTYGIVAYILNIVRIYSIPCCFLGITIGSIYQYVIGIRKLDVRDKGFNLIITFVTILLICQVIPLVFAVIVNGWRG